MKKVVSSKTYVLITPAHNEKAYIEKVIQAVISQTVLPKKWVMVSDRSTDRTEEIITKYAKEYNFIELLVLTGDDFRNWASQVYAINAGYEQIKNMEYEFIGNLDADISFYPNYYESVLERFQQNPKLGLSGGFIYDKSNGEFKHNSFNSTMCVAHAIQLFRRECYEEIGGYIPLKYGGPDWHAEVMVRMKGWQVESFPELKVFHHRHVGTADEKILRGKFRSGLMDYSIGSHPLFEVFKCIRRVKEKPYLLSAFLRFAGFLWSYCRKEKRIVSDEFVNYLRKEQKQRLWVLFFNSKKFNTKHTLHDK